MSASILDRLSSLRQSLLTLRINAITKHEGNISIDTLNKDVFQILESLDIHDEVDEYLLPELPTIGTTSISESSSTLMREQLKIWFDKSVALLAKLRKRVTQISNESQKQEYASKREEIPDEKRQVNKPNPIHTSSKQIKQSNIPTHATYFVHPHQQKLISSMGKHVPSSRSRSSSLHQSPKSSLEHFQYSPSRSSDQSPYHSSEQYHEKDATIYSTEFPSPAAQSPASFGRSSGRSISRSSSPSSVRNSISSSTSMNSKNQSLYSPAANRKSNSPTHDVRTRYSPQEGINSDVELKYKKPRSAFNEAQNQNQARGTSANDLMRMNQNHMENRTQTSHASSNPIPNIDTQGSSLNTVGITQVDVNPQEAPHSSLHKKTSNQVQTSSNLEQANYVHKSTQNQIGFHSKHEPLQSSIEANLASSKQENVISDHVSSETQVRFEEIRHSMINDIHEIYKFRFLRDQLRERLFSMKLPSIQFQQYLMDVLNDYSSESKRMASDIKTLKKEIHALQKQIDYFARKIPSNNTLPTIVLQQSTKSQNIESKTNLKANSHPLIQPLNSKQSISTSENNQFGITSQTDSKIGHQHTSSPLNQPIYSSKSDPHPDDELLDTKHQNPSTNIPTKNFDEYQVPLKTSRERNKNTYISNETHISSTTMTSNLQTRQSQDQLNDTTIDDNITDSNHSIHSFGNSEDRSISYHSESNIFTLSSSNHHSSSHSIQKDDSNEAHSNHSLEDVHEIQQTEESLEHQNSIPTQQNGEQNLSSQSPEIDPSKLSHEERLEYFRKKEFETLKKKMQANGIDSVAFETVGNVSSDRKRENSMVDTMIHDLDSRWRQQKEESFNRQRIDSRIYTRSQTQNISSSSGYVNRIQSGQVVSKIKDNTESDSQFNNESIYSPEEYNSSSFDRNSGNSLSYERDREQELPSPVHPARYQSIHRVYEDEDSNESFNLKSPPVKKSSPAIRRPQSSLPRPSTKKLLSNAPPLKRSASSRDHISVRSSLSNTSNNTSDSSSRRKITPEEGRILAQKRAAKLQREKKKQEEMKKLEEATKREKIAEIKQRARKKVEYSSKLADEKKAMLDLIDDISESDSAEGDTSIHAEIEYEKMLTIQEAQRKAKIRAKEAKKKLENVRRGDEIEKERKEREKWERRDAQLKEWAEERKKREEIKKKWKQEELKRAEKRSSLDSTSNTLQKDSNLNTKDETNPLSSDINTTPSRPLPESSPNHNSSVEKKDKTSSITKTREVASAKPSESKLIANNIQTPEKQSLKSGPIPASIPAPHQAQPKPQREAKPPIRTKPTTTKEPQKTETKQKNSQKTDLRSKSPLIAATGTRKEKIPSHTANTATVKPLKKDDDSNVKVFYKPISSRTESRTNTINGNHIKSNTSTSVSQSKRSIPKPQTATASNTLPNNPSKGSVQERSTKLLTRSSISESTPSKHLNETEDSIVFSPFPGQGTQSKVNSKIPQRVRHNISSLSNSNFLSSFDSPLNDPSVTFYENSSDEENDYNSDILDLNTVDDFFVEELSNPN